MDIKKAIPIGIESFKEIIDNDYYYVDKTLPVWDMAYSCLCMDIISDLRDISIWRKVTAILQHNVCFCSESCTEKPEKMQII